MLCKICQKYHKEGHPLEGLKRVYKAKAAWMNKKYKNRSEAAKKAWETKRKKLLTSRKVDKK